MLYQLIEWVLKTEHEFFPMIAGELGHSLEDVSKNTDRLSQFDQMSEVRSCLLINHVRWYCR